MAIFSAFDGLYYADENHFTEFLDGNEDVIFELIDAFYAQELQFQEALFLDGNEDVIELRDALHAEELQFQEALQASMISAQMTNAVSLSPPPMAVLAMPEPCLESSVVVNETGASSLSFCEICNERKENDQMFRHESCVHSFCLYCMNKHVGALINDGKNIVTCPGSNCKCVLELDMCRPVLSKEVLDLWDKALCKELVASLILYCPFKDCSAMMANNNEGNDVRESECPVCHRLFCVRCSVPWHSGVECEDYQRMNEDETGSEDLMESKLAKEKESESSPQCKIEGCPQTACSKEMHTEMSSQKGSGEPFTAGTSNSPTSEGEYVVEVSSPIVKPTSDCVADISLSSAQDDGKREVHARKSIVTLRALSRVANRGNTLLRNASNSKKPVSEGYAGPQASHESLRDNKELHTEMSSQKGSGEPFTVGTGNSPTSEGEYVVEVSSPIVKPTSDCVAAISLSSAQDDGKREVHARKSIVTLRALSRVANRGNTLLRNASNSKKPVSEGYAGPQASHESLRDNKELHTEMSSQKGSGEPFTVGTSNSPTSEGEYVIEVSSPIVKPTSDCVADISLSSAQDDGKREVHARKSIITLRALSRAANRGNTVLRNASNSKKPVSEGYAGPQASHESLRAKYVPKSGLRLERGHSITNFTPSKCPEDGQEKVEDYIEVNNDRSAAAAVFDDDVSDGLNETDDELLSDGFDSDASQKSHETRKKNRWFKEFFESLNNLTIEEINEPKSQWHCPACQDGPGAIRWYKGIQPLMTHCNTQGKKRMKLHQELAELLDEELRRRRTPVTPVTEVLAKWKALRDEEKDHQIFWPPMVVIRNTCHKQDVNQKWTGMGTQKLLDYFSSYSPVKAQHSYGPEGHRGMSILIFESSARGYLEAECLHVHFAKEGRGRSAWDHCPVYFLPDGERQLYGFMAVKEDLDIFNQHFKGKSKLKYELRSYQEMVMNQVNQMSEDNKQLIVLENRFAQEQSRADALQESLRIVSEKLRMRTEESCIVRQRINLLHEKHKEEVDFLQQYFQDQLANILKARNERDENLQPEQNENMEQSNTNEYRCREEKIAKSMNLQEMKDFEAKKDKLIQVLVDKMVEIKKRHREEEEVMLETEFDAEPSCLVTEGTTGD